MPMPTLQRLKTAMKFRPFFFISFLLTAVFYTLLNTFTDWSWSTNLLISWNIAVSSYLVKTMTTLWSVDHRHILQHAQQQDASKWIILLLVIMTLLMCLIAIVLELTHLPNDPTIKYSQTTLLFIQDSKKTRNNSSTESINHSLRLRLTHAHMCSIGFKSGLYAGSQRILCPCCSNNS